MVSPRTVLIDGSSLIYRAFFALPSTLRTPAGLPTNAIYGFARMFDKVLAGRRPTAGAVVFDAPGPTFRDRLYPDYKAERQPTPSDLRRQFPYVERLVQAQRFPQLRIDGVEADDVIGTLTAQAVQAGHEVLIVSIDKDFTQLISERVRMIDTMRDITYDPEVATRKWGVPPSQFVDLLALLGDELDNIPGVPGIGKKTAIELLKTWGSIEAMLEHVEQLPGRARRALSEHAELARLCKQLATIRTDVDLPVGIDDLRLSDPDPAQLDALYRELAFYSLLSEQGRADAEHTALTVQSLDRPEQLDALGSDATEVGLFVLTEHPGTFREPLVGLAFASDPEHAWWVSWPPSDALRQRLARWLDDPEVPKVVHAARNAWAALHRHGLELSGVVGDPGLGSFLVDPAKNMPHRLDQVAREYLQRPLPSLDLRALSETEPDAVAAWAGAHAAASLEVWPILVERMQALDVWSVFEQLDLPVSWVLAKMQVVGILVDHDDLASMGEEFSRRKARVESRIFELAGHPFNVDSPKQLATVLFEELELPVLKRTKTGYSTAADVLERLADRHEIAAAVLRQRSLAKLISTYTNVLTQAVEADGRIHAAFEQTVGVSGRIITTDPDLQRTPIRTEDGRRIRQAFVAPEHWRVISADWSQIDLRLLAHYSQDDRLLAAFAEGADVHARTAAEIYEVAVDDVSPEQRRVGKTVNFATIYGQGATALGQLLGISRNEATRLIDRYFTVYSGVAAWRDAAIEQAHVRGGVSTLLGRRRQIPELSSRDPMERAHAERIALNTTLQGTAADLCKLAMLVIDRQLSQQGRQARMLLQIHDELVLEAPADEVEAVRALVRQAMEHPHPLRVPLVVDIGVGHSWAEAKQDA